MIQSWCWPSFHSQTHLLHAPQATKIFVHTLKQSGADLFSAPAWGLREHTAPPIASQAKAFPLRLLGHDLVSFCLSPALHIWNVSQRNMSKGCWLSNGEMGPGCMCWVRWRLLSLALAVLVCLPGLGTMQRAGESVLWLSQLIRR